MVKCLPVIHCALHSVQLLVLKKRRKEGREGGKKDKRKGKGKKQMEVRHGGNHL